MKRSSLIVGALAAVSLIAMGASAGPETITGKCVKVIDGDTLIVDCEKNRRTVNLEGVDAPELEQPWGKEVRSFVRNMVRGREVELIVVDGVGDEVTARVTVDGVDLAEMLVGSGLAWVPESSADSELVELGNRARDLPCGLWLDPEPVPPWEFRAISS